MSPLEMTAAYASIAIGGVYVEPITFTKIELSDGSTLLENKPKTKRVYSENTAYYMTKMLEGVVESGTGRRARLSGMSVAGKTGTTSSNNDAWFCGYTPYYTAAVWIGHDKDKTLSQGSTIAAALWKDIMKPIHDDLENRNFDKQGPFENVTVSYKEGIKGTAREEEENTQELEQPEIPVEPDVPSEEQPEVPIEPQPPIQPEIPIQPQTPVQPPVQQDQQAHPQTSQQTDTQ